ncbi:propionyl-CoA carboxylase beta chain [Cladophialophora psammophila CBS 110553]|uniref:Propionyl-CoA carboxylase beta chain n=1 Tax=Cladophialophora psammophila CBS 110553 TaxID=1182543 RepID=W9X339_9EURO|nr:propionyl-CoA carboxylase beta chain [Cladophialophora psammophila CBS 110553]EXJ74872.1 propionyl-CoA carboxylase beta chain [Cladophialophora psammophila CBS 110553]
MQANSGSESASNYYSILTVFTRFGALRALTWIKVNALSRNAMEAERQTVTDFTPSNNVQGGRCVLLTADDFTLRAGHADGATFEEALSIQDLGGPSIHCGNGVIDNYASNEKGCYDQIAQFVTYVPNHGGILPPVTSLSDAVDRDCSSLRSSILRRRQRMYQVRPIILSIVDKDSFFEIGPHWGRSVVVGLAQMNGRPIVTRQSGCAVMGCAELVERWQGGKVV